MEFVFETDYDQRALTAMARALRKTLRRRRSLIAHFFGLLIVALAVILTIPAFNNEEFVLTVNIFVTWLAAIVILVVVFGEDSINGYIARRRMIMGMESARTVFTDEGYRSETEVGTTEWKYERIDMIADTRGYFVFLFDKSHAQVYDQSRLTGGTPAEFRRFIIEKTGKSVQNI